MGENKPKPPEEKPQLPPVRSPKPSQRVQEALEPSETKQQPEDSRA